MFASATSHPDSSERSSRSSSIKHRTSRRRSLRIPHQALNVPIPPTLLQSPYLNSPQSIFQRAVAAPRHPNAEDEQWLQDTVPLSLDARDDHSQRASSSQSSHASDVSREEREQSQDARVIPNIPPSSPPLVRWRETPTTTQTTWLSQTKSRSAPCLVDQGYFIGPA